MAVSTVTTKTQIAKMALARIGITKTIDIEAGSTDTEVEAVQASLFYDMVLSRLLGAAPWPFALKRVTLAPLDGVAATGWDYVFAYPSDCVRLLDVWADKRRTRRDEKIPYDTTHVAASFEYASGNETLYVSVGDVEELFHFWWEVTGSAGGGMTVAGSYTDGDGVETEFTGTWAYKNALDVGALVAAAEGIDVPSIVVNTNAAYSIYLDESALASEVRAVRAARFGVVCDSEAPDFEYIADVTDPTKFSAGFVDALAWGLAAELSNALPVKPDVAERAAVRARQAYEAALCTDLKERQEDEDPESATLAARY